MIGYIIGGAILFLIIMYFVIVFILYKKTFTNPKIKKSSSFNEHSPYYPYRDHIKKRKQDFEDYIKEDVSIVSNDNLTLRGYSIRNQKSDKVVIVFHGFKSKCNGDFCLSYDYYKHGYSLLLVDQRSHGRSDGKYIGMGILERYDCLKWIEFIIEKCGPNVSILLSGTSMGAATIMMASELIKVSNVKGIVADCGFSSCFDEIRYCLKKLPYFPIMPTINLYSRLFAKYDMKKVTSAKSLANSEIPLLIIHGDKDDFVPSINTKINYGASKAKVKEIYLVKDAIHAESYLKDKDAYEEKVLSFLNQINF